MRWLKALFTRQTPPECKHEFAPTMEFAYLHMRCVLCGKEGATLASYDKLVQDGILEEIK